MIISTRDFYVQYIMRKPMEENKRSIKDKEELLLAETSLDR